jgi:two-component system sensor histidine kinase PilS (NtrC family)
LKNKNNQQIGNIFIFQDLSEIKQMEESLEKSKRLALIGEMAAGLAHEMRNPLASIAGSIELLTQGLVLDETDKRLMQIILRGKDQLDSFVRDFLLLARPIPEKREPVNVYEITSEVLDNLKLSNDWSEKITVVQKLENKINIMANKEQIRQVIRNLALNAVQAMKEEGGTLSIEIKEKYLEDRKEYVEIKIGDTGQGIEVEDMKKVFEPFFTNKEKGTGLGLTIVGRIVEGYKGKIKIDSKINQGTTCIVLLPCENEIIV